jgi:hypothetical protein
MQKYVERDGQTYSVKVGYSLGGHSVWSSEYNKRGYYLYVTPVEVTFREDGSVLCQSRTLFSGYKVLLKEVNRQSKKAQAEAEQLHEQYVEQLINTLETERKSTQKEGA